MKHLKEIWQCAYEKQQYDCECLNVLCVLTFSISYTSNTLLLVTMPILISHNEIYFRKKINILESSYLNKYIYWIAENKRLTKTFRRSMIKNQEESFFRPFFSFLVFHFESQRIQVRLLAIHLFWTIILYMEKPSKLFQHFLILNRDYVLTCLTTLSWRVRIPHLIKIIQFFFRYFHRIHITLW